MSSRIYPRDDSQPAEPLVWPQVDGTIPFGKAGESGDPQARREELQREIERRVQEARSAGFQDGLASAKTAAAAEIKALNEKVEAWPGAVKLAAAPPPGPVTAWRSMLCGIVLVASF